MAGARRFNEYEQPAPAPDADLSPPGTPGGEPRPIGTGGNGQPVGSQPAGGPAVLGGRFRCDSVLKTGHGVDTFLGTDLLDGSRVVVKRVTAADVGAGLRVRLQHEAEVLSRLATIPFRSPITMGTDGAYLYLVQPFIPGETLQRRLTRGPLSVASTLRVALDLLGALQRAHDEDVLHRDVKPANLIVDDHEPVGRAVLIDFGFARSPKLDVSVRDQRVGTARYLAPEAAGVLERAVDERSDLYSAGVVLFECLAGRPPFEGSNVGEVLRHHLNTPAPQLRGLGVNVPRALDAAVQRLLRKDPGERYQSAGAARADFAAIADALDRGISEPAVVIGLHDRRQMLTEPAFVGRADELGTLARLIRRAGEGRGGLVLLEAESGGGKTRLLEELAQQSQTQAWILRGQGVDQAARRPFELLEEVVHGIVAASREHPALAAALRSRVDDRADAVVAALPDLTEVLGEASAASLGPEAYGETRSINALSTLLDALGTSERPAVVLLDDCQWADGPTLRLLSHWQAQTGNRGVPVLVIAAFRSEEVGPDHPLRSIDPLATVALPPFMVDDLRSLAESMAGPLPEEALEAVSFLSEGSPFMASAVLRGLVEAGALVTTEGGWEVDRERLADVQTSRRAALFLLRRLELLAPDTLDLLSVGAVLGKEFDVGVAVELCGEEPAVAAAGLVEAGQRRIVWVDEQAGRARFLHDKLREALLSRLDSDRRRQLHLLAAVRIEAIDPDRVFELAYHFDAAGSGLRALPYAERAAESARAQHSLDVAVAHYRMAQRSIPAGDAGAHARIAEGLGDVLTLGGSYDEATDQLERALSTASSDFQRATLEGKLGDVAFRRGDQRSARDHLERAVRQLGGRLPTGGLALVAALAVEVLVQVAHSLLPRLFLARRSPDGAERDFLAIRLYSRLAYVYWFSAGKVPCAWAHLREMNLAERYPPSAELAQAYSEHAPVMTMAPWFGRGIAYAGRSLAIRTDLGDLWGQGQSLNFYGVALYAASRYREAIDKLQEAVRLLDQTGDRWEVDTARWNIAFCHYRLGELAEAVAVAETVHDDAIAIGDDTAAGISVSVWSRASAGRVPAELVRARMEHRNDDAQTAAEVLVADAVRLLREGSPAAAVATMQDAAGIVSRAGLRQEYVAPVLPWLATALRSEAETLAPYAVDQRQALLRQARRAARMGWRVARWYRNNAPHALRERGLLAALGGRDRRARRLLSRSLAVAESQDARYEHALTRQAFGRVGLALGGTAAEEVLARADADIAALVPTGGRPADGSSDDSSIAANPSDLSLADRFATLVTVGRRIASAPSPAAVYASVREAAVSLLRGDECHVIELDDPSWKLPGSSSSSGGSIDRLSHSLVLRAIEAGGPVVLNDNSHVDSADSIVLSGLRSALCSPIFCDGQAVACLYATHSNVEGLFGQDEIQMTELVTALAGAVLEHVAGTEARFRSLAQNSSDVITIVNRDFLITYQSTAVTRVFGFEPSEIVGRPLADWLHPDDAGAVHALLQRVLAGGQETRLVECRLHHHDGSWRDVETAVNNLVDDPSVNGVVMNTRDISDRKRAERELRETLGREQEMRESLQELDRIKTDFVSSVSHELRTPLSSIIGYVEMMA
ncbi:MAG: hypothetical protein QOJ69_780, partial [Actinomycetota bacterium]|nr:hypothetical protein [Actinomycetota bacterium]